MKLIEDEFGYHSSYIVINGNGSFPDLLILKRVCEKYDGSDKIIAYLRAPLKRYSGLSILSTIPLYLSKGYRTIIFTVDKEHIQGEPIIEIRRNLIGINILEEIILQKAYLLKCKLGSRNFNLFCVIFGLTNCIEEELSSLIEQKLGNIINIQFDNNNPDYRRQLKKEISLRVGKKELKRLLKETTIKELETAFPNICAALKKVEEEYLF